MEFEWDPDKAARKLAKRDLDVLQVLIDMEADLRAPPGLQVDLRIAMQPPGIE